ncbi:hypothetical protein [Streptomyces sp. NPDC047525]|uniref:DUF6197 family protein n=1 Tax=Streptomyces sp. NPDC047525 TaxID=3155264 RepID=UPI0033F4AD0F
MHILTSTPARPPATQDAATELSLEARMAIVDASMTVRLDEAAVAYEVRTAHIPTDPVDLADVVTVPLTPTPTPKLPAPATPMAALLERARDRMETSGWCSGALTDERGAVCLLGAIRKEAGGRLGLESDAAALVLDSIRKRFGDDVDSVPGFNDSWANGRVPLRILGEAANLADARGI